MLRSRGVEEAAVWGVEDPVEAQQVCGHLVLSPLLLTGVLMDEEVTEEETVDESVPRPDLSHTAVRDTGLAPDQVNWLLINY